MSEAPIDSAPSRLALFPLSTVLFPGGHLPLRIFETRYVDMISACMRSGQPFGVVPIRSGSETGSGADFFSCGTCAVIEDFDQGDDGLLHIAARGTQRFEVIEHDIGRDGLISASTRTLAEDRSTVDDEFLDLVALLRHIFESQPEVAPAQPWLMDEAAWVAFRLCELMPLPTPLRVDILRLPGREKLAMITALLARPPSAS